MSSVLEIPEICNLDCRSNLIRIPDQMDIPLTPRVRQIVDTAEFRRLSQVSQLGLVSLAYPAANHTRFEHSLGVYRMSLLYLKQLASDERFASAISGRDAEVLIVAALLHDLGHWPFCHPIEDIHLPGVPEHEMFANSFLLEGEVADTLRDDWGINPREVVTLLSEKPRTTKGRILASILSGPIDIDKMDYLTRDSLHAGVPYGRNFDQGRLIGSLCLNEAGNGLAITEKGRTAAEMMVFARYVMFSEVYWHHTVRAATAMLQRAFYLLYADLDMDATFRMNEHQMITALMDKAAGSPAADLLDGLFGAKRSIYKRLQQYSYFQNRVVYDRLAGRSFPWLAACSEAFANILSKQVGQRVAPHEVLIDAPPAKREVEFNIQVKFLKENVFRMLGDVSPVVKTLAKEQFDDYVKRVRVYVHPRIVDSIRTIPDIAPFLIEAIDATE